MSCPFHKEETESSWPTESPLEKNLIEQPDSAVHHPDGTTNMTRPH